MLSTTFARSGGGTEESGTVSANGSSSDAAERGEAAQRFLSAFRARHGRAPRILHIGNIANNAYLNAKLLNAAGFDCDVICYDYYHLMACPEWEDADFDGDIADQFKPDWTSVDLGAFRRPEWFAQGPQLACIHYLLARRRGQDELARRLWIELGQTNGTRRGGLGIRLAAQRLQATLIQQVQAIRLWPNAPQRLWAKLERWAVTRGTPGWLVASAAAPLLMLGVAIIRALPGAVRTSTADPAHDGVNVFDPVAQFAAAFPQRLDQLTRNDWMSYAVIVDRWAELFSCYDIVQAYATDVMYPMLARKRPYLGFEHGTLRDFTLGDSPLCRLTALGYQQADHVFITNGDCLDYARRINVGSYTAMVHPIDDARIRSIEGDFEGFHRAFGAKYLFVCPLRHDWATKGTDQYIRALPGLVQRLGRDVRVVMTKWGQQLEDSRELAKALGVEEHIVWVEPLNRSKLIKLQKSADVVFDQIALPHFGATAPQAIAAGVPVIMSYDPSFTEWIVPEPAPILSAWTPGEIVDAVQTALDPAWRSEYIARAAAWFDKYHSGSQAVGRMSEVYHHVCAKAGLL